MQIASILDSRRVRLGFASVLIAGALYVVVPNLYNYRTVSAVVNTNTVTLTTPIEGTLVRTEAQANDYREAGTELYEVRNRTLERSFLLELKTERESLTERTTALRAELQRAQALRAKLQRETARYRHFTSRQLEHEIAGARHWLRALKARYKEARRSFERARQLEPGTTISRAEHDRREARYRSLRAEIDLQRSEIALLETQLEAVGRGVFLGFGRNDVPYSSQRRDEVALRIADLRSRIAEYGRRAKLIDRQLAAERTRLAKIESFQQTMPFDGMVWRVYGDIGSQVQIGDELMVVANCRRLHVEALVDRALADQLRVGRAVELRLIDTARVFTGHVRTVFGPFAKDADRSKPAVTRAIRDNEIRVLIGIAPDARRALADPSKTCNIGRPVAVTIRKIDTLKLAQIWTYITDVF